MKKLLIFSLLILIGATSCKKEDAKKNAMKFLKAFYTTDMDAAMKVSTSETKEFLTTIKELVDSRPLPDSIMELQKKIKIDIDEKGVKVDGDKATVTYTLTPPTETGAPAMTKELKMVKQDGKWLASYTMDDYMAEMQASMDEFQKQNAATDSTQNLLNSEEQAVEQAEGVQSTPEDTATATAPAN